MSMTSIAAPAVRTVRRVTEIDADLSARLLRCWLDVSNAGGAVGFVPPVSAADVSPALAALVHRVYRGSESLVVMERGSELLGFAALGVSETPIRSHCSTVQHVQVHPDEQGTGAGTALMLGVHTEARALGMEMLRLAVRSGTGRERFYERLGYREWGRLPGGMRVGAGDDRDEIHLYVRL